jgi:hypothetical protein
MSSSSRIGKEAKLSSVSAIMSRTGKSSRSCSACDWIARPLATFRNSSDAILSLSTPYSKICIISRGEYAMYLSGKLITRILDVQKDEALEFWCELIVYRRSRSRYRGRPENRTRKHYRVYSRSPRSRRTRRLPGSGEGAARVASRRAARRSFPRRTQRRTARAAGEARGDRGSAVFRTYERSRRCRRGRRSTARAPLGSRDPSRRSAGAGSDLPS